MNARMRFEMIIMHARKTQINPCIHENRRPSIPFSLKQLRSVYSDIETNTHSFLFHTPSIFGMYHNQKLQC